MYNRRNRRGQPTQIQDSVRTCIGACKNLSSNAPVDAVGTGCLWDAFFSFVGEMVCGLVSGLFTHTSADSLPLNPIGPLGAVLPAVKHNFRELWVLQQFLHPLPHT